MPLINSKRELAVNIMLAQLNDPYLWGGNAMLQDGGVDCSGAIRFTLDELDIIPQGSDYTSYQFAEMFPEVKHPREGVLAYYMRGDRIRHVEMVLGYVDGEWWTIGAIGGGSGTDTPEEAAEADARVKPHPMPDNWVKLNDPFLAKEI